MSGEDESTSRGIVGWIQNKADDLADKVQNEGLKTVLNAAADAKDFKDFVGAFNEPEEQMDLLEKLVRGKLSDRVVGRIRKYSPDLKKTGTSLGTSLVDFIMQTFQRRDVVAPDDDDDDEVGTRDIQLPADGEPKPVAEGIQDGAGADASLDPITHQSRGGRPVAEGDEAGEAAQPVGEAEERAEAIKKINEGDKIGKKEFLPGMSAASMLIDKLDDTLLWPIIEPFVEGLMEILKRPDWKMALVEFFLSEVGLGCVANNQMAVRCMAGTCCMCCPGGMAAPNLGQKKD